MIIVRINQQNLPKHKNKMAKKLTKENKLVKIPPKKLNLLIKMMISTHLNNNINKN
jgi:hypothetical protein